MKEKQDEQEVDDLDLKEHQKLVSWVVKRFINTHNIRTHGFNDLKHFGEIGLWKASRNYDSKKGEFSTYAVEIIQYEILKNVLKDNQSIRIPERVFAKIKIIRKVEEALLKEFGREPSMQEISKKTGMPDDDIETLQAISKRSWTLVSLDTPMNEEGGSLKDSIPSKPELNPDDYEELGIFMKNWQEEDEKIIKMRLGQKISRLKVAKKLGMSTDRVRRIEEKKLRELRNLKGLWY